MVVIKIIAGSHVVQCWWILGVDKGLLFEHGNYQTARSLQRYREFYLTCLGLPACIPACGPHTYSRHSTTYFVTLMSSPRQQSVWSSQRIIVVNCVQLALNVCSPWRSWEASLPMSCSCCCAVSAPLTGLGTISSTTLNQSLVTPETGKHAQCSDVVSIYLNTLILKRRLYHSVND